MKKIMSKFVLFGMCATLVAGGGTPLVVEAGEPASEYIKYLGEDSEYNTTSGKCGDNVFWNYDTKTKTLSITGSGAIYDYKDINDTDRGGNGSGAQPWQLYCYEVKNVKISNKITRLGDYTFTRFEKLKSLTLPKNLTYIGKGNFFNAYKLKKVTIPDKVKIIGDYAFSSSGIRNLSIGKNVKTIGEDTFAFTDLYRGKITIKSKKIKTIGRGAFYNLGETQKVVVPSSKAKEYKKMLTKSADKKYKAFKSMTENKNAPKNLLYTNFDISTN